MQQAAGRSPAAAVLLAEAQLLRGDRAGAETTLAAGIEGSPLAYRGDTRLAEIRLAQGKTAEAERLAGLALAQAPAYLPAHRVIARALAAAALRAKAAPPETRHPKARKHGRR